MTTTTNIDAKRRAELLTAAIAERKTLRSWERKGSDPETRPDTPAIDEIEKVHNMPKSDRKARTAGERQAPAIDDEVRKLFTDGTITHPVTKTEIAQALDVPRSTAGHACRRLVKSDEMTVTEKPLRFWLTAAGKPGPVPQPETKTRARKVHTIKGNGKTVHAAHAHRGENGTEFHALCSTPATLMSKTDGEVTCKRCVKALDAA